jgi:hypothetical protein
MVYSAGCTAGPSNSRFISVIPALIFTWIPFFNGMMGAIRHTESSFTFECFGITPWVHDWLTV